MTSVSLSPADPVDAEAGQTVEIVAYLRGTVTVPAGWADGGYDPDAMYGTEACAAQRLSRVAGAGFGWPVVDGDVIAWTWAVGTPTAPDAGYSWPRSATVTAA